MNLDFDSLFGDAELDFDCPNCNHTFPVLMSNISEPGSKIECPNCNVTINVEHDETVEECKNNVNNGLDDFENALNDLQKTLNNF